MTLIERIESLFAEHGSRAYEGALKESVSALEHALQCAQLAEWAHAEAPLVATALLPTSAPMHLTAPAGD
ncbi:hypothetical protein [Piscinibacter sp.]|uniref:hypothetical protein n=1 Tax=Piscinibacter sp. TaxID=1903157 RepID=UPI002C9AA71C|nr:hypothetical protein [Albitalea sp.]HUG25238.1 hypothetical protein [Albitalea sp.]